MNIQSPHVAQRAALYLRVSTTRQAEHDVSIPDQRKGERIVLLTTEKPAERSAMQAQAKTIGASELTVPATIMVVDKVPLLGTGKIDNVAVTKLIKERFAAAPSPAAVVA